MKNKLLVGILYLGALWVSPVLHAGRFDDLSLKIRAFFNDRTPTEQAAADFAEDAAQVMNDAKNMAGAAAADIKAGYKRWRDGAQESDSDDDRAEAQRRNEATQAAIARSRATRTAMKEKYDRGQVPLDRAKKPSASQERMSKIQKELQSIDDELSQLRYGSDVRMRTMDEVLARKKDDPAAAAGMPFPENDPHASGPGVGAPGASDFDGSTPCRLAPLSMAARPPRGPNWALILAACGIATGAGAKYLYAKCPKVPVWIKHSMSGAAVILLGGAVFVALR